MTFLPSFSQQQAISHKDGPMLVLAGPGSGKTAVITARTSHLVHHWHIPPDKILIITFTKAAAKELYDRLCKKQDPAFAQVHVCTFHSFFYKILQHTYQKSLPRILSNQEQIALMQSILRRNHIFPSNTLAAKEYLSIMSKRKTRSYSFLTFSKTYQINLHGMESVQENEPLLAKIQAQYEECLADRNQMDMDDLQCKAYELLQKNASIREFWDQQYSYVMIDEYQDISQIQFACIHQIFGRKQNLFAVGDDDQSIYGFRGADPQIMLDFFQFYPEGKQVLLDTNYRCAKPIVQCAENLIKHNQLRFEKKIVAFHQQCTYPIQVNGFSSRREQLEYLLQQAKINPHMAVLYRNNRQVFGLSEMLWANRIPYFSKEGVQCIYDHWIVKELLAVREGFLRLEKETGFWMQSREESRRWKMHRDCILSLPPFGCIMYIRKAMGFEEDLKKMLVERNLSVSEGMELLDQFAWCMEELNTWEEYTEYINTQKQHHRQNLETKEGVYLSTMHGAKGLEFDEVCILDVNESIVPYKKAGIIANLEEERRLFYVAITRAKKKLQLLYVKDSHNKLQPSRFLYEALGTTDLGKTNQLFTSSSFSLTSSSYSLASSHSSKASDTISYSSSSSMFSKTGSSSSFSK